jgi:hypothetical protein
MGRMSPGCCGKLLRSSSSPIENGRPMVGATADSRLRCHGFDAVFFVPD